MTSTIELQTLSSKNFSEFGDVIETKNSKNFSINDGMTTRFHDLAYIDCSDMEGKTAINIFRSKPYAMPLNITMMERHPASSQAFFPLSQHQWIAIVAPSDQTPSLDNIKAFLCDHNQGVNYAKGVWHHPLVALDETSDFLVIDRVGPGENCDIFMLDNPINVIHPA